mmetsp:Transcript_28568/g.83510  ORF Transcript_28568/g.83510 Transcript_28568/m.83510 type:complete len:220 (+) Transcript_28568:117-776(+)
MVASVKSCCALTGVMGLSDEKGTLKPRSCSACRKFADKMAVCVRAFRCMCTSRIGPAMQSTDTDTVGASVGASSMFRSGEVPACRSLTLTFTLCRAGCLHAPRVPLRRTSTLTPLAFGILPDSTSLLDNSNVLAEAFGVNGCTTRLVNVCCSEKVACHPGSCSSEVCMPDPSSVNPARSSSAREPQGSSSENAMPPIAGTMSMALAPTCLTTTSCSVSL